MDDPIFDPWCLGDEVRPTPSQRPSRWRGAGKDLGEPVGRPPTGAARPAEEGDEFVAGMPGTGDRPHVAEPPAETMDTPETPLSPDADAGMAGPTDQRRDGASRSASGATPRRRDALPEDLTLLELGDIVDEGPASVGSEPVRGGGPPFAEKRIRPPASASPSQRREPRPIPPARHSAPTDEPDPTAPLRALLVPRIASLSRRLSAARHRTTVDDRLSQQPPSVRFRIEPWRGPFDPEGAHGGAVLEVVLEGGSHGSVAARFWLDPLSTGPTERRGVPASELTGAWLDTVLLDFVRKALR